MKDSFYTPTYLAQRLINIVPSTTVSSIADFSVGGGELIKAGLRKWPEAKCFGTDISKHALDKLSKQNPSWILGKCNFLNPLSRKHCKAISQIDKGIDLILLNPPFSCVGGTRHTVALDGITFTVSTAMAFVVEAIKYLSLTGSLYAILPNSVAYSQKDEKIWKYLIQKYHLKIIEESNCHHFEHTSSKVLLASINCKIVESITRRLQNRAKINNLEVFRGKISMHKVVHNKRAQYHLIHSTNLRNNSLEGLQLKCICDLSKVSGPALLIPRVGLPNPKKIATINAGQTFVLSDCVLAIKTSSNINAKKLKDHFLRNWKDIEDMYKGTGANYITVENLKRYLNIKKTISTTDFDTRIVYNKVESMAI